MPGIMMWVTSVALVCLQFMYTQYCSAIPEEEEICYSNRLMSAHMMPMLLNTLCKMFDNFPSQHDHQGCSAWNMMEQYLTHSFNPPITIVVSTMCNQYGLMFFRMASFVQSCSCKSIGLC